MAGSDLGELQSGRGCVTTQEGGQRLEKLLYIIEKKWGSASHRTPPPVLLVRASDHQSSILTARWLAMLVAWSASPMSKETPPSGATVGGRAAK